MANPFASLFADDDDEFADSPAGVGGNAATESVRAVNCGVLVFPPPHCLPRRSQGMDTPDEQRGKAGFVGLQNQ